MDGREYLASLDAMVAVHERMAEYHRSAAAAVQELKSAYLATTNGQLAGPPKPKAPDPMRAVLPYSDAMADQVLEILKERSDGLDARAIATAIGLRNGLAIRNVLARLHAMQMVRGELLPGGAKMKWYPAA